MTQTTGRFFDELGKLITGPDVFTDAKKRAEIERSAMDRMGEPFWCASSSVSVDG